ncbi:TAXI family TRAP transporter solute-binding subunit [Haloparvum sedimenti]|uniref:TAXI family TRAP transporter solute-binding subunit n=1 Tax=Haloparvum sedimenti TaxID=1678448 RepID=UPI0009B5A6B6|nr:TAXI family TRAP transporter solute-binding subunit [Haloparvum sedimenti]
MDDWRSAIGNGSDRRKFLKATGALGIAGIAGCTGGGNGGDGGDGGDEDTEANGGGGDTEENGGGDGGSDSVSWTIGTSGPDSATHASGVAMSQVISENSDMIDMSAQTTGGTAANLPLIANGELDIAQSTSWGVVQGNAGNAPYNEQLSKTMTQVLPFMSIEYFLIKRDVEELSDIETVSDIPQDGSIDMAWGNRGGTNYFAGVDAFELSGIENPEEKYNISSMDWGSQSAAIRDGRLDICMGYTVSQVTTVGWEQEVDATTDIDVVQWEFDESDIADSGMPYVYLESPADVWEQEISVDQVPSLGVGYETVFPAEISQELAYEFVSVVNDNIDQVRSASAVLEGAGPELTQQLTLASPDAPVHPGAEQFMKEEGLWSDDLTTLEEYESNQ